MGHAVLANAASRGAGVPAQPGAPHRWFDLIVAVPAVVVLAVPFAIVAVLVRWTSPGPAFFRQPRVGYGGKVFFLTKFRTMRQGHVGALVTAEGDRRITAVGRVLRRTKFDELPQLLDVVRGDMALVGPRPEVPRFVELYDGEERAILAAWPGLASMAQLVYPHEAESLTRIAPEAREEAYVRYFLRKKVAVDLAYERRRTFATDLLLLVEIVLLIFGFRPRVDLRTEGEMAADR
jgi:lipopolysaccharide/colanic/teichoic acid biosynthesis glycosyltransferase